MKKILIQILLMAVLMTACSGIDAKTPSGDKELISSVIKDNCSICGANSTHEIKDFIGQDNIGLINLNTFDFYLIEINRYDYNGELIEKATGAVIMGLFDSGESNASIMCDPDRGHASIQITSSSDGVDADSLGEYLCQDCLDKFDYHAYKHNETLEVATINLLTGELRPLEESCPWFAFDNYIVDVKFRDDGRVDMDITYRPLRYEGPEE